MVTDAAISFTVKLLETFTGIHEIQTAHSIMKDMFRKIQGRLNSPIILLRLLLTGMKMVCSIFLSTDGIIGIMQQIWFFI